MRHHQVFDNLTCWNGYVKPGFTVNFLGVKTKASYYTTGPLESVEPPSFRRFVRTSLPEFDEEYFEWIDMLQAVTNARECFRMMELGAGYGRWLANAVAALRLVNNLPYTLIAVEPEPTHFKWLHEHLRTNGVDLARCSLIEAAVTAHDGYAWFFVGRAREWYGQAIAPRPKLMDRIRGLIEDVRVKRVKSISLNTLLRPLDFVDYIDIDIQGAEFDVLKSAAQALDAKVRIVHIGTHERGIESGLRELFHALRWENINDYPSGSESDTLWGPIRFQDGVQTWINPKLQAFGA